MSAAHLVASLDELCVVNALYLNVYLQSESSQILRFADVDLRVDNGVPGHVGLARLTSDHLKSAQETS